MTRWSHELVPATGQPPTTAGSEPDTTPPAEHEGRPAISATTAVRSLRDEVVRATGIRFADDQLRGLARRAARALDAVGVDSLGALARRLAQAPDETARLLAPFITIGETRFLRHPAQLEALRRKILPQLVTHVPPGEPLVVWSAGCATGEEAYSLAAVLREQAPHLWPSRLRVVATDINHEALARARAGRYGPYALRSVDADWCRRWITSHGKEGSIDPSLRKVIDFRAHNLARDALPSTVAPGRTGIIVCRNVLMYFHPDSVARVLEEFRRALAPWGVLLLGPAESLITRAGWSSRYFAGAIYHLPGTNQDDSGLWLLGSTKPPLPPPLSGTEASTPPASAHPPREAERRLPRGGSTTTPAPSRPRSPASSTSPPPSAPSPAGPDALTSSATAAGRAPATGSQVSVTAAWEAADRGDLAQARAMLLQVLDLEKTNPQAYFLLALVEEQRGDQEAARDALKRLLFLDRDLVLGHFLLAALEEQRGELAAALRGYRTVRRRLEGVDDATPLPYGEGPEAGRVRELAETRISDLSEALTEQDEQ